MQEDWQYSCEAESGSADDCLGLFQPVSGYADFPGIYSTAQPGDGQSKSLPDSPFSLKSSTSHQRVPFDTSFSTRASALTNLMLPANDALGPHMLAGSNQPGMEGSALPPIAFARNVCVRLALRSNLSEKE